MKYAFGKLAAGGVGMCSQIWVQDVRERMDTVSFLEIIFKNEYIFGDCKRRNKKFYEKAHVSARKTQYASIVRDWLWYSNRIPTCIILRASSYESNTYRSTYYNFEICVSRVSFCFDRKRVNYYFYEWYVPRGILLLYSWDIYFYGVAKEDWTNSQYYG